MSYTVSILGSNSVDGSTCLSTLAKTSSFIHSAESPRRAEGYISVEGKTCVGVEFLSEKKGDIAEVHSRLIARLELRGGKVMVRSLNFKSHEVGVVNLLVPQTDLSFLSQVFSGIGSKQWILENTGWWKEYNDNVEITPPGVVLTEGGSDLVVFRVGIVTSYFDEKFRDLPDTQKIYHGDSRGYDFRSKHQDLHISQVGDQMIANEISARGYEAGFSRLVTNEGTGLSHGYTVLFYDELNDTVGCAHLKHENTKGKWEKINAFDTEGNNLVITGKVVSDSFLNCWPHEVVKPTTSLEGVLIQRVEGHKQMIER